MSLFTLTSALVVVISTLVNTSTTTASSPWKVTPTITFVMHPGAKGDDVGEVRLYDGGTAGTRIAVSVLPWLPDKSEVILASGNCGGRLVKIIGRLKLEIIPTRIDQEMKPIVLPSPLQEVWDYYSLSSIGEIVDHRLSVMARDASTHTTKWCGDLSRNNKGDPLPTGGY